MSEPRGTIRRLVAAAPWLGLALTLALGGASLQGAIATPVRFAGFLCYESGAVAPLRRAAWPGRAAGLAVRDVVTSVDGEPVSGGRALATALGRRPLGAEVLVRSESPSRVTHEARLRVSRLDSADLAYTFVLPFSIGLLYLALGALIFLVKRRTDDAAPRLTLALCLLAATFYLTMFDAHTTYRFSRLWLSYPLLGPLSVHLFAVFPERRPSVARPAVLLPLYLVSLGVVAWRELVLPSARDADLPALLAALLLSAEFVLDLALLGLCFRRGNTQAARNRAKTMFVGMALSISVVIAWQFAARAGSHALTADQAMMCSAVFPLLIAYALLRRNLFDIDAVLRASLVYGLATALVIALYFAGVFAIGLAVALLRPLGDGGEGSAAVIAVASTLVAAAAFRPLRLRVQRLVDRLLRPGHRPLAEELALLGQALSPSGDAATVADELVRRIEDLVQARWVALLLPAGADLEVTAQVGGVLSTGQRVAAQPEWAARAGTPLSLRDAPLPAAGEAPSVAALGAELVLPLSARGALLGVAALGPRRAGIYRYGDLRALAAAATPIALALENALLVGERDARERLAALGALAAVIVHEVKNPLGIIKVSASTLRRRADDDTSAELARCIEDEVDRMDSTCRKLLELARPDEPGRRTRCDLGALVRETVAALEPDLRAAGIALTVEIAPSPPALADPDGLRRALLNLLLNARQALLPDGGRVDVKLSAPRAGAVEIAVSDSGHGMDEATRRQLFRPFFTTRHGGTGLGLAIVKRVVEEHHGAIHVESRLGEGARFTVTLPVLEGE